LGGQPFELNPAGPQRSLLEVLLMVQDVVLGERLRPFAPGTALGGAAARYLALGERLAPPAVWDVLMEVTEDAPSQAARAAASAQRTSNKGRARHLAAALSVQGPTLTVTSRTGATVLRVHLCAPGQGQVPGALACEQLLLRCQSRAWSASGGLSLPEAMALAASGHYRAPGLGEGQPLPEDVTGALASLVQIWRLQQAGYRPQALPERADLAAVVRLADHLAQQPGPHAASQAAIQLVHHAVAPDWAPVASAAMRQQLGLAATAWAFLSQWQRHMPENFSVSPLVAGLRGLCASHMDRACPDARLAYAITQGLCAGGCTADLWRLLLAARAAGDEAGADAGDQPQVHRDGDMLSVALPIWRTHVFADGPAPGAPLGHLHGTVALTTLCADPALRTVGQRLGRALGCPPLAELFDHPWGATPQARQGLARALRAQLAAPEGCAPPIRSRLLWAMAVLGGDTALAELEDEVRAAFSLQQLCDAWRALPAQPSGADDAVSTALTALLRPHIQALRGAAAAGGALRPVVHTLVQQLGRRGRHDEALALLQTDPPLGAQVGGLQALALLTASLSEPPSPALQAQLLAAVARHKGACQELVHQEASLWRAWSGRPAAAAALADVLANVGAMPQGPLTHWLEALHAAENVAPLMRFVTTAAPQHPALGDVLINLAELASLTGHEPGLRQALASWDAARGSLTPQLRARVALVLLESAEAQGAANAPVLEVAPHDRLRLAEAVLQGHPGAEERKVAMGILADLTHTPCAVQAMGVVLAHCDLSTLGRLAPHEIHDLFDLMGAFTDDIMPDLSDKTAEQFVDLLIRLPTTTAKEAAAVAPRNVDGLTFLLRRGHFAAGRKLIQCQMRSPAAVRLSLQVFQGSSAVDLGPRWRSFFDHCAQNMQAKPAQRTKSLTSGPPAPRFVMAILVAEGLSTELRAFEERADHASNL
jgi:hypothetical protein